MYGTLTILSSITPEQLLVQRFGQRGHEVEALRGLAGDVTATHLREAQLTPAAFDAVVDGLADNNPRVRWWCVQVLDHVPDPRAVEAIASLLDDPIPRVRRNAAHALGCVACKPEWSGALPSLVTEKLIDLAAQDPNMKVRGEAAYALACRVYLQ
jgi:HEAT repeat protein